ncbi:hypothetical protein [Lactobacillus sp. CBA3605] [Lactiplantibacillus mudanjiangensis]|nr:hypothetical protein [Lactobacillus sp. CBA3605] [Lactiplantibacillus mudanjiangensis]
MFFVGFVNTLNADSLVINLVDMTGQFGGYTLCRRSCLLYTSDAADEEDSVDLGGRRIIKKNKY